MNPKQEIRDEVSAKRRALDPRWIEVASLQMIHRLEHLDAFQNALAVGLYLAIGGEVNLDPLIQSCRSAGKCTFVPWFSQETGLYEMTEISSTDDCQTGHFGIREPRSPAPVPVNKIDFMAIPGVAFDLEGNRLGRGGGYYDRLLAEYNGIVAAVAFDFQLYPSIPIEPHDRPTDLLVTETQSIKVSNEY